MADAATFPVGSPIDRPSATRPRVQPPVLTPGKVAIWLFLATEIMFFTGLIGTYIVLRAGSPPTAYSNQFPPATDLSIVLKARPEGLVTLRLETSKRGGYAPPQPKHYSGLLAPFSPAAT